MCFVERWAEVGEPTPKARLAQARAFMALCLMDRAWIRLRELGEGSEVGVEALGLIARMFLERGWPNRARRPLELALAEAPDDPALNALWERLDAPAEPPTEEPSEDSAPFEELLPLAERHMAHGTFLKAQRLLERLKRDRSDHPRVADLLWALQGDFSPGEATLSELADRLGPDLSQLAELAEDAEHTESVTREDPPLLDDTEDVDATSFPSLFREVDAEAPTDDGIEEVTQTSSMASVQELHQAVKEVQHGGDGDGDTQIMRVIHHDQPDLASSGPLHLPRSDEDDGTFDLAAFRREMGMQWVPDPPSEADRLEEEDDDLIILTGRERRPSDDTASGLETIEPDTTSERPPRSLHEAVTVVPDDSLDFSQTPTARRRVRRRPEGSATSMGVLAAGLGLLGLGVVLLVLVLWRILATLG